MTGLYRRRVLVVLITSFQLVGLAISVKAQSSKELSEIKLDETTIRKTITHRVTPSFPLQVVNRQITGTLVAEIEIDVSGAVQRVTVVQTPDAGLNDDLIESLKQWRFRPETVSGIPVRVLSRLTFYYVIERGKGFVRDPDEMLR